MKSIKITKNLIDFMVNKDFIFMTVYL